MVLGFLDGSIPTPVLDNFINFFTVPTKTDNIISHH